MESSGVSRESGNLVKGLLGVKNSTSLLIHDDDSDEIHDEGPDSVEDLNEHPNGNPEEDLIYLDETASFVAEISDGYPLRKLFEFLKGFHRKGNLRCSAERILFEESNTVGGTNNSVLNQVEIETCEFTEYEFTSRETEIHVGITLSDIHTIMRTVRKKDGVRFFKHANDPSLYIQIIKHDVQANHQGNISVIRPQTVDVTQWRFPVYRESEKRPNFTIPSANFSKACGDIGTVKCETVSIHSYVRWILLKAMRPGQLNGRVERLGNFDDQIRPVSPTELSKMEIVANPQGPRPRLVIKSGSQVEDMVLTVRKETIKALSKLNNLSPNSSIKVYLEKDQPMKLIARIGTYGTLRCFIRSTEQ